MNGIVIVDKPAGWTSQDVTARLRRVFNTRRIGHGGTLDPMATGVLPVFVGRATRGVEFFEHAEKVYETVLKLGITTDTEDITGTILREQDAFVTATMLEEVLRQFRGEIMQVPPMYSALKVDGKKLVDLARKGIEIERVARPVTIHSLTCEPLENGDYALDVTCSAGTYIRTLCADIGKVLGCGGVMTALRRTAAGDFSLESATTLCDLEAMSDEERLALLRPIHSLFEDLPAVSLPSFYERLCRNGCEIYQKKIDSDHKIGTRVRICDTNGVFFALGEVREYENGTAIKGIKYFDV